MTSLNITAKISRWLVEVREHQQERKESGSVAMYSCYRRLSPCFTTCAVFRLRIHNWLIRRVKYVSICLNEDFRGAEGAFLLLFRWTADEIVHFLQYYSFNSIPIIRNTFQVKLTSMFSLSGSGNNDDGNLYRKSPGVIHSREFTARTGMALYMRCFTYSDI